MKLKHRYPLTPLRTPDKRDGPEVFAEAVEHNIAAIAAMSEAVDEYITHIVRAPRLPT